MNLFANIKQVSLFVAVLGCVITGGGVARAQSYPVTGSADQIRIVELQGTVEVSLADGHTWISARTNQVLQPPEQLRTGTNSRVALRWSDQSVVSFGALTELEILPPASPESQSGLHLIQGILSFFHRDKPGRIRVITRGAVAGVEGTEFAMAVDNAEQTTLSMMDGKVRFGNEQATLLLTNGQQAVAAPGQTPVRTAGFTANNLLQWCFYYPAVLDPAELPLTAEEQKNLAESLEAYRAGDLLAALAKYPAGRSPGSEAERIYYAALLLSVGEVEKTEALLSSLSAGDPAARIPRLAAALRQLIAAVKRQPDPTTLKPELATELLAGSYYEQSRAVREVSLENALDFARQAAAKSPGFGFAGERVAELEFSFGHAPKALAALDQSLTTAPRNAQALALKGFLLAAQDRPHHALAWFDQALAVDSALGNAWLGRGLCRIRMGDAGGREDLLVAAALEPQRAGLRSYLGKAYADAYDTPHAVKELQLAKKLDPSDPTPWLYSALLNQQDNRVNDSIRDLEKSSALNGNRSVYRSQLLLDQDSAVRSANLASMYRDAGMFDQSEREAGRAVNADYANYSAHLFLANSFINLEDPNHINLRYETPAESEYLLANLLAPASAGTFASTISQQEYSRLFERDHLGLISDSEYLSRGAWTESASQFGTFEKFSYNFESVYRADPGQGPNNDVEDHQFALSTKMQITPEDSIFLHAEEYQEKGGDLAQYYNQNLADRTFRMKEDQEPIAAIGYHHEWSPGVHTIFLVTRLEDSTSFTNATQPTFLLNRPDNGLGVPTLQDVLNMTTREDFVSRLEIYSGELQQIWEQPSHTTIAGARFQYGHIDTATLQNYPSPFPAFFPTPPDPAAQQNTSDLFRRISFYGYHQWQLFEPLQLIGGVTYDEITFPVNFRAAPISDEETTRAQVSPKAGLIWTPADKTSVRFAYTRSLSGASFDQSDQLEPSQVAGFVQSYRSIIPESIAGANAGAQFETYDLSLEQKFSTGTYLGISGELLNSTVRRTTGAFDYQSDELDFPIPYVPGLRENLDYQEKSLQVTANQLLGEGWSFGAKYRLSQAVLHDDFNIPNNLQQISFQGANISLQPHQRTEGILHQLDLAAIYNHPSGFFMQGQALWFDQNNTGYTPAEPGDTFWQLNAFVGYRAFHRKAELTVGLLNIANQDYNLNPLNIYNELPRTRTLAVRFRLNF